MVLHFLQQHGGFNFSFERTVNSHLRFFPPFLLHFGDKSLFIFRVTLKT